MFRAYKVSIVTIGFAVLWCGDACAESSVETAQANDGGFGHRRWAMALDAGIVGASQAYVDEQPGSTLVSGRGNGRYAYTEFSRFSPGIGVRVSLGAVCKQVISGWSIRLALGYERIHYDTQFPYGDGYSDANWALTEHYSLDVRVILDRFRIKPYLGGLLKGTEHWGSNRRGDDGDGVDDQGAA